MYKISFPIPAATTQIVEINQVIMGVAATAVPFPYAYYEDQANGAWIDDTTVYPFPPTYILKYLDGEDEISVESISYSIDLIGTRPQRPR